MAMRVDVILNGSMLQHIFSHKESLVLCCEKGDTLKNLKEKLVEIAGKTDNNVTFFKEYLFIINAYQVDDSYLLREGDEIIILPWLIGG